MDFQYDIYISYAIKDNEDLNNGGWVSKFQKFLEVLILQILGEKPNFLGYGNQEKPASSELAKSLIFISILSPEYIKNESCIEELQDFVQSTKDQNYVVDRNRVLKVVKLPVGADEEPSHLKMLLSYDLYYTNTVTGEVSELKDFFNNDGERRFWLKMVDLAYDIADIIKSTRNVDIKPINTQGYDSRNVYLAETGADLSFQRDSIKRELLRHGFRVLPEQHLPTNPKEIEITIKKDLEKSRLSIHLIGDGYGEYIPGTEKSVLDIQNKLAGEYSLMADANNKKFSRLIWISPDAQFQNDKQKIFIDNLRRELEDNEGAEILQSPIEDFKMLVLEELLNLNHEKLRRINTSSPAAVSGKKLVYFIYDKIDDYEAKKIAEFLQYNNFEVVLPSFTGQLLELREIHLSNLRSCDIALIYINNVNDLWVQMKFLDLLKAPGLGRTKGSLEKALILGKNLFSKSNQYEKFEVPVLQNNDDLENKLLTLFKK